MKPVDIYTHLVMKYGSGDFRRMSGVFKDAVSVSEKITQSSQNKHFVIKGLDNIEKFSQDVQERIKELSLRVTDNVHIKTYGTGYTLATYFSKITDTFLMIEADHSFHQTNGDYDADSFTTVNSDNVIGNVHLVFKITHSANRKVDGLDFSSLFPDQDDYETV